MKKHLDISIGQFTHQGRKECNQDFHGVFIPDEPALSSKGIAIAIADGISSSKVSHIASQTAIKSFLQDYFSTSDSWSVKKSAQIVLKSINSWLFAQTQNSPYRFDKDKGYICTFSGIIFKSQLAHLFHSGDSRIYRLSSDRLEQLTSDHRRIVSEDTSYLTRALGIHDYLELDYRQIPLSEGDIYILASDGVYESLDNKQLLDIIKQEDNLDRAAKRVVEEAYDAGSEDNLSIQIVKVDQLPERNLDEVHQQINLLPAAPSLSARMSFDGYSILREIYISSRSHVFLAQDNDTLDKVVIKTPSTELKNNAAYLENFLMEDWIARRLNNPHLIKAIEAKRKRNYLYTVTEYIEGKTLAQWMIDTPSPDITTIRNIVEQISKGLQAIHRQEMVHQDLRPNNIMIDSSGTVKIIDFGATKVAGLSEIVGRNEGIVGTAQYTAPEYFIGQTGTSQSDIFSLGVITYQLLSGKLPYGNSVSKSNSTKSQQSLTYAPLRINNGDIPEWLDLAIQKAVHINPVKRYAEISEFIHELKQPSTQYLNQSKPPFIERNPVLFWQIVSFILFCLVIVQTTQ
jgi:serine/threonine protein phosphatase PrpC